MSYYDEFLQLNSDYTYAENYPNLVQPPVTNVFTGDVSTVVTTINGASGPVINITAAPSTGSEFNGVVLQVANAATVRTSISAAKSGVNSDITSFTALTGNTGVNPWTGTPNGASQTTYPATVASAAYVQAEMQGLMDKMQDVTEFLMFLVAALLASGVAET